MVTAQDIVDSFLVVENPRESTLPDDLLAFIPSEISLLGLVKLLKDALTSEHEATRTRGLSYSRLSCAVFDKFVKVSGCSLSSSRSYQKMQ